MSPLSVAESKETYQVSLLPSQWVEVLVDCTGVQGLYTYLVPPDLTIKAGDILSVPFGNQITGGIAIRLINALPEDLDSSRIKAVDDIISKGFFSTAYWTLMNRVADYYYTDLITVVRSALPPKLLGKSQRRVRLKANQIPKGAEIFCRPIAQKVLALLKAQKEGNYSVQYLRSKIKGADQGIKELSKRGWIESYLEPPKTTKPKQQKAVILVKDSPLLDLTNRQREVLEILRREGGELWLNDLLRLGHTSSSLVETLQDKGYVILEYQERLRLLKNPEIDNDQEKILTPAQEEALNQIKNNGKFTEILLHGVTGSGKTEVYLQAIAPILKQGKSALILVPEIGLTPQLTDRFRARFGDKVCVYHSGLSDGERYDTWRQMLTGTPQVVIGTRSAIFAPLPQLGMIILDEEHDSSFKQTQILPTYHAGTVAKWRAELVNCPLILGSATPSLETFVKTNLNHSPHTYPFPNTLYLSLPQRIQSRPLPPVKLVDMRQELQRGNRSMFSLSLQNALKQLKEEEKQGIIFVNRRGHSTFVSCRSCGYVMECPHCDVSLSYHYTHEGATKLLRCHYCNHTTLQPSHCPECGSPYFKFFGSGTQKVIQALNKQFPQLRCLRFDSDTTRTKGAHRQLLSQFARGEADLLVGTQMLTKGLDLAQVTLVGVIAADGLLYHSDYRAAERAFQTLTQVAGRAGRGDDPGQVIIQTYNPEHSVIQAVKNHDYQRFIDNELPQRQELGYPPHGNLILLRFTGLEAETVQKTAEVIADACISLVDNNCEILGPAPAAVMRVANRYRWHILLKFVQSDNNKRPDLESLRSLCPDNVKMTIDVDPLSIY
ncbi:MAG: primosomal protein N' [Microcystaceae cyanobacterium]